MRYCPACQHSYGFDVSSCWICGHVPKKEKSVKIIEVFQAQKGVYTTYGEAQKSCTGVGRPISRKALTQDDGTVWLLEGQPVPLFETERDMKINIALAKLTPDERQLLGFK